MRKKTKKGQRNSAIMEILGEESEREHAQFVTLKGFKKTMKEARLPRNYMGCGHECKKEAQCKRKKKRKSGTQSGRT